MNFNAYRSIALACYRDLWQQINVDQVDPGRSRTLNAGRVFELNDCISYVLADLGNYNLEHDEAFAVNTPLIYLLATACLAPSFSAIEGFWRYERTKKLKKSASSGCCVKRKANQVPRQLSLSCLKTLSRRARRHHLQTYTWC